MGTALVGAFVSGTTMAVTLIVEKPVFFRRSSGWKILMGIKLGLFLFMTPLANPFLDYLNGKEGSTSSKEVQ